MFVRYFGVVTPHSDNGYGDLTFSYFEALDGAGISARVIATNMSDIAAPGSRWDKYSKNFIEPIPSSYINIVCGPHDALGRLLTVGCPNIAIVGNLDEIEPQVLLNYDMALCQSLPDTEELISHGVNAICAIPEGKDLAVLVRNLV